MVTETSLWDTDAVEPDRENPVPAPVSEPVNDAEKERLQALRSLLYKSLRIGDAESAILAAEHLRRALGDFYVLKALAQCCGEDCAPEEFVRLAPAIYGAMTHYKSMGGHTVWHLVYSVAKARKWYETESGQELEKYRHVVKEKEIPEPKFPSWVYDRHTAEGWRRLKQRKADWRLDGGWGNRWKLRDLYNAVTASGKTWEEKRAMWLAYWRETANVEGEGGEDEDRSA